MGWVNRIRKRTQHLRRKYLQSWVVTLAFFAFSLACFLYAYVYKGSDDHIGFFLSLTTGLTGFFLTFLAVNVLIQNAKDRDDLESMSMMFVHNIDYLTWVWLGGKRVFDLEELTHLLSQADYQDALFTPTQNIALDLGNKAFEYRRTRRKYVRQNKYFGLALDELSKLAKIRDTPTINPVRDVVQPLRSALDHFTQIVEINFDGEVESTVKNASKEGQLWRAKGDIVQADERGKRFKRNQSELSI